MIAVNFNLDLAYSMGCGQNPLVISKVISKKFPRVRSVHLNQQMIDHTLLYGLCFLATCTLMSLIIVVADDDLPMRLFVSEYLEMCGYSVIAAEDGQMALELVEKYHPHLLVTDIMMPRMDGYELVRQVRQRPEFRLLPVVFLTERNSTEERIRGYKLGCDSYLPKPFEIHELGAIIRNLLERSQIMQTEWHLRMQTPTLSGNVNTTAQTAVTVSNLSKREKEVLELITRGLSNIEIGDRLHLSGRTIEKYVSNLLRKTETSNRAELVRIAIEQRLID